jgi:hypothetical protein
MKAYKSENVFVRLYDDAMNRLVRLESLQREIRWQERDALAKVISSSKK